MVRCDACREQIQDGDVVLRLRRARTRHRRILHEGCAVALEGFTCQPSEGAPLWVVDLRRAAFRKEATGVEG
jgi:hypothetical protein